MTWRPILEGAQRGRALAAAKELERQIAARQFPLSPTPDLASGEAGMALLPAYLARVFPDERYIDRARELLDAASRRLSEHPLNPGLFVGFSGVAWATEHLRRELWPGDPVDLNEEIDEVLLTALKTPRWEREYDLIYGLVGIGVYWLERIPRPASIEGLRRVLDHLESRASTREGGLTWWTSIELAQEALRARYSEGYCDLGMAHGVPSVLALLAGMRAAGLLPERGESLLKEGSRWLFAQRRAEGATQFPHWAAPGHPPTPSRSAWCYGDPGIAGAFIAMAGATSNAEWQRAALDIARGTALREPAEAGTEGAGLCHGTAGLGHLLNRVFQATGDAHCLAGARFWLEQALLGDPSEAGFLEGAAGTALALLAASTSVEPTWDRVLLLSYRSIS